MISIHALREEGDNVASAAAAALEDFYPRPPRGGRRGRCGCIRLILTFLSTPSARRATSKVQGGIRVPEISIHALREEGDLTPRPQPWRLSNFYPRPPRGGRPDKAADSLGSIQFLSTPSARRATQRPGGLCYRVHISIHALREEGDSPSRRPASPALNFYPRPPRGGRPGFEQLLHDLHHFYPRPPRGGRHEIVAEPFSEW